MLSLVFTSQGNKIKFCVSISSIWGTLILVKEREISGNLIFVISDHTIKISDQKIKIKI